jgi:hypothetical protein
LPSSSGSSTQRCLPCLHARYAARLACEPWLPGDCEPFKSRAFHLPLALFAGRELCRRSHGRRPHHRRELQRSELRHGAGRRSLRSRPPEAARRAARRAWARSAAAPAWHVACLAHGDGWGAVRTPTDNVHAHIHLVLPLYYRAHTHGTSRARDPLCHVSSCVCMCMPCVPKLK